MKTIFYWFGGIGSIILLLVSIYIINNPFGLVKLTQNSYPKFFIYCVIYDIIFLLILYGIYCITLKIINKKKGVCNGK